MGMSLSLIQAFAEKYCSLYSSLYSIETGMVRHSSLSTFHVIQPVGGEKFKYLKPKVFTW